MGEREWGSGKRQELAVGINLHANEFYLNSVGLTISLTIHANIAASAVKRCMERIG